MAHRDIDKSYLEIKVTFVHVLILLAAVLCIGIFLFYLGYQAGKSSVKEQLADTRLAGGPPPTEEVKIVEDEPYRTQKQSQPSITEEIKLHQRPSAKSATDNGKVRGKKEKIKAKPVTKIPYYAVQVGAFEYHTEAKSYSDKFIGKQYPTEIHRVRVNNRTMYRVLVGRYPNSGEAKKEIKKLEKIGGKTGFFVKKLD